MTLIFAVSAFLIRKLPLTTSNHTILIMILCILVSLILFKTSIYPTVLAVLFTIVSITIFEAISLGIINIITDIDIMATIFNENATVEEEIKIALFGIPTNIFLLVEMIFVNKYFYKISNKGWFKWKNSQEK